MPTPSGSNGSPESPCENPDAEVPVTVSITRVVAPDRFDQMIAWVRAGSSLAERFPGFLGTGWVRPGGSSEEWHMLYRFDSDASLAGWEASPQRAWWLGSAQGLVGEARRERRTGIEGWFDTPQAYAAEELRPSPAAPPRWKQAVMIWTAFFPLSLLIGLVLSELAPGLAIVPRVLLTTVVMTPVMTYVVLPRLTRWLDWWLQGRPAPWRK
jgi:antibiotic biosynthesis monooxygenase (ABM) superfamily enzyme